MVTDRHDITVFGPTQYRRYTDAVHAETLAKFEGIDLVGFLGQTLAHAPRKQGALQVGEGSPLAPLFLHACARYIKAEGPIVFLDLGGMSNITWVGPAIDAAAEVGALLAFDTGPATAPVNDLV